MQRVLPGTGFGHPPASRVYLVNICFIELETSPDSPVLPSMRNCDIHPQHMPLASLTCRAPGVGIGERGVGSQSPTAAGAWHRSAA